MNSEIVKVRRLICFCECLAISLYMYMLLVFFVNVLLFHFLCVCYIHFCECLANLLYKISSSFNIREDIVFEQQKVGILHLLSTVKAESSTSTSNNER
jgi:hypothetical protein